MEMWLKRSTLVFLTVSVAVMVISGQAPVILDKRRKVEKVEIPYGSPLILNCSLSTNTYERFRVAWYFNPSGPSFNETHQRYSKMFNRSAKSDGQDTEGILWNHTSNATYNDSGWYFCRVTVEIPSFHTNDSSGTEVVITKSMENTTHPSLPIVTTTQATASPTDNYQRINWSLWIPLAVCTVVLIVLMLMFILKKRCSRNRGEDPIYANTQRKQPSPHLGMSMDNLKTVPSSQNLRNPSPGRAYEQGKRRPRP